MGTMKVMKPAFTQPLMYKKIAEQETTRSKYAKQLIAEGSLSAADAQAIVDEFTAELEDSFKAVENYRPNDADFLEGAWSGFGVASEGPRRGDTAIPESEMKALGELLTTVPDGFTINKKLQRVLDAKKKMFESGEGFDWATAEALAFGSLLNDEFGVRLSGQDVGRGTFSHRHAIWYDQENENKHIPLKNVADDQPTFEAHDSPLSEAAVLGFEYGFHCLIRKRLCCGKRSLVIL